MRHFPSIQRSGHNPGVLIVYTIEPDGLMDKVWIQAADVVAIRNTGFAEIHAHERPELHLGTHNTCALILRNGLRLVVEASQGEAAITVWPREGSPP